MSTIKTCFPLQKYKHAFNLLAGMLYRNIYINSVGMRILGINYMDDGPDWVVKRHRHSFFEFHYVIENSVFTTIDGSERRIDAGQFYLMTPGKYHSHRQGGQIGHIGFAMRWEFDTEYVCGNQYWSRGDIIQTTESFFHIDPEPVTDSGAVLDQMLNMLNMAEKGAGILELQIAFLQLLLHVARCYDGVNGVAPVKVNQDFLENHAIYSAVRFIEENYAENIDVKDIASSVHLSYSHLARLFKANIGETINQYLNRVRCQKAEYLLKCTDCTIADVALKSGFQSEYYFSSFFKKQTGMSPTIYRKQNVRLSE